MIHKEEENYSNLNKTTSLIVHTSRPSSTLTYMFRRGGNLWILDEQLTIYRAVQLFMATVFEMGRYGLVKFPKVLNESAVSIFSHEGDNSPIRRLDNILPEYAETHSTKKRLRHCRDRLKYCVNILHFNWQTLICTSLVGSEQEIAKGCLL
jgi:hypothetical protein